MSSTIHNSREPIRVVLADANVLYSRVLRDYLLYAADAELITIHWSAAILSEVVEHLAANRPTFDAEAGQRLIFAMNRAFPAAEVAIGQRSLNHVASLVLPDEDDRHVLAAAVAAGADLLCTDNIKDFPPEVMDALHIRAMTADGLLALLIADCSDRIPLVHRNVLDGLPGATDTSTIAALRRAGAGRTADLLEALILTPGDRRNPAP